MSFLKRKKRKPQDVEPGMLVIYQNRPMIVMRVDTLFKEPHVWIAPRDIPNPSLDDIERVRVSQVELD